MCDRIHFEGHVLGVNRNARTGCMLSLAALLFVIMMMSLCLLTGCSHNPLTYSDGFVLETTVNPETWTIGVGCRYGKILTVVARENTELELSGEGSGGANKDVYSTGASSGTKIKFKVGKQITGYYVDAVKAGADPDKYLKDNEKHKLREEDKK